MRIVILLIATMIPGAAAAQSVPNPCADPAGYARHLVAANPGADYAVLAIALEKAQQAYGCRPPDAPRPYPQTTRCSWEGIGTAREWVCRSD